jgi:hypothetical protein
MKQTEDTLNNFFLMVYPAEEMMSNGIHFPGGYLKNQQTGASFMIDITLYRSALCPRCHMARKTLYELIAGKADIHVEEVDIITNPLRTWKDGVRFIPTLKSGGRTLTGIFLSREVIQGFLEEVRL